MPKKFDQEYHMNRIRMQIIKVLSYVTKNIADEAKRRRINRSLIEVLNELNVDGDGRILSEAESKEHSTS